MLLISLMRSTPGFWMPERRNQPSSRRALYRDDGDPSLRSG